jgi:hypothetical protein
MKKIIPFILICFLLCSACYKKKPKPGEYTMSLSGIFSDQNGRRFDSTFTTTVFIRTSNANEIIIENVIGETSQLTKTNRTVKGRFFFMTGIMAKY